MKSKRVKLSRIVFLIIVIGFLFYQRSHKPRVFVLHSYSKNFSWVKSVNLGIKQVFNDKSYISLRYYYMNTKTPHHSSYLKRVARDAKKAIDAWQPDILIAVDNNAQNLVAKHYENKTNMKIVLAGTTPDILNYKMIKNKPNVAGIFEVIPVRAIKEVLSLVFHHKRRIYYLSDNSNTAKSIEKNILDSHWGKYTLVEHQRVNTFAQWKKAIQQAQSKADIVLVSVFQTLTDKGKLISSRKVIEWSNQHSKIPIVGIYEFFIINGGLMAIAVSGIEQGYTAAWITLQVIEKKLNIAELPILPSKNFSLYIRKKQLKSKFPDAHIPVILGTISKGDWKLEDLEPPELKLSEIKKMLGSKRVYN